MRRDAAANRDRLLAAAVTSVMRDGAGVSLARIAEEAGVGVGTLYRRYPSRAALFEALQARAYRMVIDLVRSIENVDASGIDRVRMFLEGTVAHGPQLVLPYHGAPVSMSVEVRRLESELRGLIGDLVERSVRDGTVRPDLSAQDLVIFGSMIAVPLPNAERWEEKMARQIDLFLAAVGTGAAPRGATRASASGTAGRD